MLAVEVAQRALQAAEETMDAADVTDAVADALRNASDRWDIEVVEGRIDAEVRRLRQAANDLVGKNQTQEVNRLRRVADALERGMEKALRPTRG